MIGVGMVVGKGMGRGFYLSFEQNRYRYFQLGCRNARYDMKSYTTRNRGEFPIFRGTPCNDITFSKIRHNLARKKSENEKARDFS